MTIKKPAVGAPKKDARPKGPAKPAAASAGSPAAPLPHMWSKAALLAKAQRYAEEMNQHPRDDWRFGIWSTLMLELLARAALAHVSPILLAESKDKDSWNNLYHALGHSPKAQKFIPKSIDVSSVLTRLAEIRPQFDSRLVGVCAQQMARRNEDLHSGGTPFDGVVPASWQPLFYEACDVLMISMGGTLADLIGTAEAKTATSMIAAAKDESAKAVEKNVQAHRTVWDAKTDTDRKKLAAQAAVRATKQAGHRVKCPACGSDALVVGGPIAPPVVKLKDELIVEKQEFLPSKFECVACGLKIAGLPQLHVCGLGSPYTSTKSYDPAEYYAPPESFAEYEPDNND